MRVSVLQLGAGLDREQNRRQIRTMVLDAVEPGSCDLVVLPEASQRDFGGADEPLGPHAESLDGPFVSMLHETASQAQTTLVAGMFEATDDERPFNTLVVVDQTGLRATYRKSHLYDAFGYAESDRLTAGASAPAVAEVAGVRLGFMTCYDLRFPELGRALVDAGAEVMIVPAAWLVGPNKTHHWATLLTARAIENTVWVVGAGQPGPRYCGHSAVVDPAGLRVAELGQEDGVLTADIDPAAVGRERRTNPSLLNRRWTVSPL